MTRLGSLLFCAMVGLTPVLASCGGGDDGGGNVDPTEAVLAAVPGDNTVAGWTRDPANSVTAGQPAAIALDFLKAEEYIDGGANPFYTDTFAPDVFAWQNYMNTSLNPDGYTLSLYVMKMPTAAQASAIYDSLLDGTKAFYSASTWADTSPMIGDMGRITNSGTDWWINFRKGAFYCEARLTYAEVTDTVGKQAVADFATAVAAKM